MVPRSANLAVQIVQFVEEYQPGIVACELIDSDGRRHRFIDKVPVLSIDLLDGDSQYPQPGHARCTIVREWRDADGRELVNISTSEPDHLESTEGLTDFVVLRDQVSVAPQ